MRALRRDSVPGLSVAPNAHEHKCRLHIIDGVDPDDFGTEFRTRAFQCSLIDIGHDQFGASGMQRRA